MSITACPMCGSRKIFQGRLKDGVLTGYTSKEVCRDCGYHGSPIIFDSEKEYYKFLEGIQQKRYDLNETDLAEEQSLSEKDKQVLDYLKDVEEDKSKENQPKITKNTITSLGFVLVIVGILITAATSGNYFIFSGIILIPSGIILFFVGILGPIEQELKSEEKRKKYESFPKIAGILLILIGVISIILYSLIFVIAIDPSDFSINEARLTIEEIRTLYISVAIIQITLSVAIIIGGINAYLKKSWGLAIIGSILGTFVLIFYGISTIICLLCLILIAFSRYNFKKQIEDKGKVLE